MKCLKIEKGKGLFLDRQNKYVDIDKMGKEDILHLLDIATCEEIEFEMDEIDENMEMNPAHKIIYQNLSEKLKDLLANKNRFLDESEALYKDAIKKYQV